jgi:class 3 adenylate cyclase/Tfp pilus assembly protein PilF
MSPDAGEAALDEAERLLPLFPETARSLLQQIAASPGPEVQARALALLALHDATARSGEGLRRARERLQEAETLGATSALARGWLAHVGGYLAYREASDEEALRRLNQAAALWVEHPRLRARTFDALGMLLGRRGDLDGAFDYFSLALQHKRSEPDPRSLAVTHGNLGRLALIAGRHQEAERWYRLDLEHILAATERPATVAHVRSQIALALAGQGRLGEARRELLDAIELAPPGSIVRAYALKDLARMELSGGAVEEARRRTAEVRREVEEAGFGEVIPWLRLLEGELALRGGEEGVWGAFEEAWQGFLGRQDPQGACEVAWRWADALQERGDRAGARGVLERAVRLAEEHLFRQQDPLARLEDALDGLGPEGSAAVLQGRIRRMLGGVSEHWLLERRSGAYHARRLQGERTWLTVWTCDLRGFTEFCARTEDPQRVVRMLNRFFARVGQALLERGGCIDKYVGDSILAYFHGEGAAERACKATHEAYRRLGSLNDERAHLGEPELLMGVGVATGWVVEGNVGFAGKLEHTIIGTPVNAACRLVARAAAGQTLLDDATARELPGGMPRAPVGSFELKGLGEVKAWELVPPGACGEGA